MLGHLVSNYGDILHSTVQRNSHLSTKVLIISISTVSSAITKFEHHLDICDPHYYHHRSHLCTKKYKSSSLYVCLCLCFCLCACVCVCACVRVRVRVQVKKNHHNTFMEENIYTISAVFIFTICTVRYTVTEVRCKQTSSSRVCFHITKIITLKTNY